METGLAKKAFKGGLYNSFNQQTQTKSFKNIFMEQSESKSMFQKTEIFFV